MDRGQSTWIVVPNWNGIESTLQCLASLERVRYPNLHVAVVDNNSTDDSVLRLRDAYGEHIMLIANPRNLGFAGGSNVGIRHALKQGADYVMLLNNDTVVNPDFLSPLIETLRSNPQVGAVTPKIYSLGREGRIWAAGGEIRWCLGHARSRGRGQLDHEQFDQAGPVEYGTGCCLLIARTALDSVGLLDERYFAYWEDTDWCMRARRAGFEIWYEPSSHIWHAGGQSTHRHGRKSPFAYYFMIRNNIWFVKHYANKRILPLALTGIFCRLLFYSSAFLVLRRCKKLRNVWSGAYDGWLGPERVSAISPEDL